MRRLTTCILVAFLALSACTSKAPQHPAAKASPSPSSSAPAPQLIAFVSSNTGFGPEGGPSAIEETDATGAQRRVIYKSEHQIGSLSWSPEASKFVFTLFPGEMVPPGGIWVLNGDGTGARKIVDVGASPAWSPNGNFIAFAKGFGTGASELYLIRPDGRGERKLTSCGAGCAKEGGDYSPSWSPDGRRIVFHRGSTLFVVNNDGSGVRELIHCAKRCFYDHPAWSPDGTRIAFNGPNGTLFVINSDGTTLRRLYSCQGRSCLYFNYPAWAPDGKTLLLTAGILGGRFGQIVTLTLNDSLRTLTTPPTRACCGVWVTQRRHQTHP